MSDQSNVGTPENSDSQDTTDWQKRYTDLQGTYTKSQQELSELRQYREMVDQLQSDNPEEAALAAQHLGLSFVEDEPPTNPQTALEQRLERIENWLGSQNEQEALERLQEEDTEYMDTALEGLETQLGRELTREEVELLVGNALVNRTEEGHPGIEEAIRLYNTIENSAQSRWKRSKRVSTPSEGQEGVETPNLDEGHSARVAAMIQKYQTDNKLT